MTNAHRQLALLFTAVALLAGCGGGDDYSAPPPPPPTPAPPPPDPLAAVPDAAKQSIDGLASYLKALTLNVSDTREPVAVDGLTLPASDTAEPTAL